MKGKPDLRVPSGKGRNNYDKMRWDTSNKKVQEVDDELSRQESERESTSNVPTLDEKVR